MNRPAVLVLEDGSTYTGIGVGADGRALGEVVFQTSMTGYQEVITDPSYRGQIVVMTAPQMGNVGVNSEDNEARRPFLSGFAMREMSPVVSNWRSQGTLETFLGDHGIIGIDAIDTRALTRRLRTQGAMRGALSTLAEDTRDPRDLIDEVKSSPGLEGRDLVSEVTCEQAYSWDEPSWAPRRQKRPSSPACRHVIAFDFGIKRNILAQLRDVGCRVTVLPAHTPPGEVIARSADGYFLSNGPGDPAAVPYAADLARALVSSGKPLFGICLGHQILGLALGGRTYKLRFGHHGANHPVKDLETGKVAITAQNHGFAVDIESLAGHATLTHVNLNDGTVEGMKLESKPVFGVQYHPEASPGPHDAEGLFDRFVSLMK